MNNSPAPLLASARNLINTGNISSAQSYIKKIKNYKNNAEAIYLLAVCHAMSNEHGKAESLFKKTIKMSSATAPVLVNLGLTQMHQKKFSDAIQSFSQALSHNNNDYDAIRNLSVSYKQINDHANAEIFANKAISLRPADPQIINIMASTALYDNRSHEAIQLYTQSLKLNAEQPHIYTQLSNAYNISKDYDNAEKILRYAINKFPDTIALNGYLARFFESRNRKFDALSEYENILSINKSNISATSAKARVLISLEKFDDAELILNKAHKEHPESHEVTSELCNYFILTKHYEDAYQVSKKYISTIDNIQHVPENIILSHSMACRYSKRPDEARATLTQCIKGNKSTPEMLESLYFLLADILDSEKQYDEAFNYYKKANSAIPRPSDILYYETIMDDIINTVDRKFLKNLGTSNNNSSIPVFIVGMPRSGTSLVEQIISCHPDVYGAGELTDLWKIGNSISGAMNLVDYTRKLADITYDELNQFSCSYLNSLTNLSNDAQRISDKLPHNFIHIGLIELLFPNAKIIHCQRHPFDTCLSIYFRKFNDKHVYAQSLSELARFYKHYESLMDHWKKNSSLSILTVNYEDMVKNQEDETRKIINHLDLSWNDKVLNYYDSKRVIMTPSSHQANKPIYTDSMYRWRHYENHIKDLTDIFGMPE